MDYLVFQESERKRLRRHLFYHFESEKTTKISLKINLCCFYYVIFRLLPYVLTHKSFNVFPILAVSFIIISITFLKINMFRKILFTVLQLITNQKGRIYV